jgi:steroid 5-alpha reductase family enzyme
MKWVVLAYVIALGAALATAHLLADHAPLVAVGAADVVATVVVFGFSVAFDNSSFYDPYWSVAPIAIAGGLAVQGTGADGARRALVVALVTLWGARLTWNWARGWDGLRHEDWRYVDLRKKSGRAYWLVSFLGIHFFPTVLVFLGCLPLFAVLGTSARPLGPVDALAALVTLGATALEAIADEQLRAFRKAKTTDGAICDVGLWAWSRHPNYLGEIGVWVGVALFGAAAGAPAWTWCGAGAMVFLFTVVSIPMIERRSRARRPDWPAYVRRTSMLMLWPPRRSP